MLSVETSIVIPAYNSRHLEHTVDSCVRQIAPEIPYEVIIVDDGSTDGTTSLIHYLAKEYPRNLIRVYQQDNGGPGAALCAGVETARGNKIIILDSDDLLHPGAVDALTNTLRRNSATTGEKIGFNHDTGRIQFITDKRSWFPTSDQIEDHPLLHAHIFGHPIAFLRTRFDSSVQASVQACRVAQDYALTLSLVYGRGDYEPYGVVPEPLYYYRMHHESLSNAMRNRQISEAERTLTTTLHRLGCSVTAVFDGRNPIGLLTYRHGPTTVKG